jgi:hypothetical protein
MIEACKAGDVVTSLTNIKAAHAPTTQNGKPQHMHVLDGIMQVRACPKPVALCLL